MNKISQFLLDSKVFYLATTKDGIPYVRPFGAIVEWDNKLYICTNNTKDVYSQMIENPLVEISSMVNDKWIRLKAKVVLDNKIEAREAMLNANPNLKAMYKPDDGLFEVLYLTNVTAQICSFTDSPEELTF